MSSDDLYPLLVADIGATNCRLAMVEGRSHAPMAIESLPCADFASLSDAVRHYLSANGDIRPLAASIAIASPVVGDFVQMTNNHWRFSLTEVVGTMGWERLLVINDFTALAMALPSLGEGDRTKIGGGESVAGAPIALLGPGSGLGVSGLVYTSSGEPIALQGEGGHVSFAPRDDEEMAILSYLLSDYPHLSVERLLSGPGLELLHRALAAVGGEPFEALSAEEITRSAIAGDSVLCCRVVDRFCAILGTVAGNLVLTLGARGGLYVGGGIVPKLGELFTRTPFRACYEAKGRYQPYLEQVPSYLITAPWPALFGAHAAFLADHTNIGVEARAEPLVRG